MTLSDRIASIDLSDEAALRSLLAEVSEIPALRCAILLRLGLLDAAHQIAQEDHSNAGSYWHGIMHRAEGDYPNSKYWFARSGGLPAKLGIDAAGLTDRAAEGRDVQADLDHEWRALAQHCAEEIGVPS